MVRGTVALEEAEVRIRPVSVVPLAGSATLTAGRAHVVLPAYNEEGACIRDRARGALAGGRADRLGRRRRLARRHRGHRRARCRGARRPARAPPGQPRPRPRGPVRPARRPGGRGHRRRGRRHGRRRHPRPRPHPAAAAGDRRGRRRRDLLAVRRRRRRHDGPVRPPDALARRGRPVPPHPRRRGRPRLHGSSRSRASPAWSSCCSSCGTATR